MKKTKKKTKKSPNRLKADLKEILTTREAELKDKADKINRYIQKWSELAKKELCLFVVDNISSIPEVKTQRDAIALVDSLECSEAVVKHWKKIQEQEEFKARFGGKK